jgi:hypothetical protein
MSPVLGQLMDSYPQKFFGQGAGIVICPVPDLVDFIVRIVLWRIFCRKKNPSDDA